MAAAPGIHYRPIAGLHSLQQALVRFKDRRHKTLFIIEGPQKALEYGIQCAYRKGLEAFQKTEYYEDARDLSALAWEGALEKTCDLALALPQTSDAAVKWIKIRVERHPENRLFQWILAETERYEGCEDLQYVERVAQKIEAFCHMVAPFDLSEFSSTLLLTMQDVQDITPPLRFASGKRREFYKKLEEAPETIKAITHGSPAKPPSRYNRFSRALVHQTARRIIPDDEFKGQLTQISGDIKEVCIAFETSTVHTLLPKGINKAAPRVAWFIGRRAIRWYLCNLTGLIVAGAVQYGQQLAGYEEDELFSHDTITTTHFCVKWMLWLWMLNGELRQWKEERAHIHDRLNEGTVEVVQELMDEMKGKVEERAKESTLSRVVKHSLPPLLEKIPHSHITHKPPPETIYRRAWNWFVSYIPCSCRCRSREHLHED